MERKHYMRLGNFCVPHFQPKARIPCSHATIECGSTDNALDARHEDEIAFGMLAAGFGEEDPFGNGFDIDSRRGNVFQTLV